MNGGAQRGVRAGFWKRLAAAWVDCFVIYTIATFASTLGSATGARIALEPLSMVVGVVYGTALLTRWGQTLGKMLVGISVTTKAGDKLSLRHVLLREVLGKWGIAVATPVALGRGLVGQAWVSTVYDALILLPVLPLQLLHYLIAKRAWYDQVAGTVVERTSGGRGRAKPAFATLMAAAALGVGTKATEFAANGWVPCRLALFQSMSSIAPYEAFLRRGQAKPVDYVISLFDRFDVVVICERLHPEGSQWDFIYEVVRDPRFIDRVGHVFTEYGQVGMQPYLDSFMATDGLAASEIHERVVHLMRHWPVWPVWINTNVYTYLTRLYALNQSLPPARRIHHHFTDVSVNWPGLTREEYWAYRRSLANRDEQMARHVFAEMGRLAESETTPPKCLVVTNYRHAFDLTERAPAAQRHNTFEYLKDAFGDRAANVLLNTRILFVAPIAGGVWDAAFEETGNRPAGFDFEGSPFGEDPFDLFPFRPGVKGRFKYRDVFTGLVYTHPREEQYMQRGVPGYFAGFEEEALRRAMLIGEDYRRTVEVLIDEEEKGQVPVKDAVPDRLIESLVDLSLVGVTGAGLLIGAGVFALGRRTHDRQRGVGVKKASS